MYPTAFSGWGEEERAAMQRVIASNRFTMGAETEAFESELAAFNHRTHAICCNSGSSANLLAVTVMNYPGGDTINPYLDGEVRIPALAWGTTYAPFKQANLGFELLDCDDSWCVPAEKYLEDLTTTEPIVTCSILGNPAPLAELNKTELSHPTTFWLNDDCEAFGATIGGKPTASFGTMATQSFFWSHQLGAIEGGAVLTDNDELATLCRMLRDHGLDRTTRSTLPAFDKEYQFHYFGYNMRPVEMHMAIAREQLKKVAIHRTARRRNWSTFVEAAKHHDLPIKQPALAEGANPFGIHFELVDPRKRQALVLALRSFGIDCRLPTGGSFRLHPYGEPWRDQQTPRADAIHAGGMFVGNAPYDISDRIEMLVNVMRSTLV